MVQLTNASGVVTQSYDYDAFGNQFSPSLTDSNLFRYSGEYFDKETDFYYLRARQYSPAIGRFTQEDTYWNIGNMVYGEDPIALNESSPVACLAAMQQSRNLYVYATNNPVMQRDSSGKVVDPISLTIGVLMIAAVGILAVAIGTLALLSAEIKDHPLEGWLREHNLADAIKEWAETQREKSEEHKQKPEYYVYQIMHKKTTQVVYVGMTNDFGRRQHEHQEKNWKDTGKPRFPEEDYIMYAVSSGLDKFEARLREQFLISAYTIVTLQNAINSVAASNPSLAVKQAEIARQLLSGIDDGEYP